MTRIEAMREAIRVMEKERRIYSIRCEGLKVIPDVARVLGVEL